MGELAVNRRVFAVGFAPGALAAAALALVASVLSVASSVASAQSPPASGILLSVEPAAVSESSGTTSVTVTALVGTTETLAAATDVTVSVTGGSSGGQATSGTDFTAVADFTINLAAGATSATATFNLVVANDTASEGPETITVSGTTTASLTVTSGALTINDDDKPPPMNATGCTDGTHVTNPSTNTGLVADCQNLVAARNHWTNHPTNVNLAHDHKLRNWTANITTWTGLTLYSNRAHWLYLDNAASADASQRIGGTIPAQLGNLTNLLHLRLNGNRLSGEIPAQLGNLTTLNQLRLHSNQLSGEIPAQLGNLTNLRSLWLSDNWLRGEIPAQLGNLANLLSSLNLSNNRLRGEIPAQLGNLTNLDALNLSNNRLSGEIPTWLGDIINLEWLYLHNNRLRGEIPAELGNLYTLTTFWFCGNYLTGALPAGLRSGVTLDFTGDHDMIGTCRRPAHVAGVFPEPPPPPPDAFGDDDGSGHEAAVNAIAQAGITRGCAPRRFCPDRPATRAQTAAMIYRSVAHQTGVGAPYAGRVALTDVPAGAAWWNAAQWAASTAVMPATPDGEFDPAGAVTRADAAIALAAALEHLGLTSVDLSAEPQHLFADAQSLPDTTVNAIEALHRLGITLGCTAEPLRFCPDQPINRAQIATMLARTIALAPNP